MEGTAWSDTLLFQQNQSVLMVMVEVNNEDFIKMNRRELADHVAAVAHKRAFDAVMERHGG